MRHFRK